MIKHCEICGEPFTPQKESVKRCSRKCYYESLKKGYYIKCPCGNRIWKTPSRKKRKYCSNKCLIKYRDYNVTIETREKISDTLKGNIPWNKGKKATLKQRKVLSEAHKGVKLSEKHKQAIRTSRIGSKFSENAKKNMRLGALKYLKTTNFICPRIGKNENKILDNLEKEENIKIKRQYEIDGYFLDGYCKETNTAYEIDEEYHNNKNVLKRDMQRQSYIENVLNCVFVRINDGEK